jgi:hypothetical protein
MAASRERFLRAARRFPWVVWTLLPLLLAGGQAAGQATGHGDLTDLSLEDLLNIEVTQE